MTRLSRLNTPLLRPWFHLARYKTTAAQLSEPFSERLFVRNPATGEIISSIEPPASNAVDAAIKSAHRVYESGVWSTASPLSRSNVLSKLAQLLEDRVPELARIETLQTGRVIREMNAQIGRLPEWLRYYAALLRTHQGFIAPTQGKLLNYVNRVPLGVVTQITVSHAGTPLPVCSCSVGRLKPFNHPLLIAVKKLAPALAAGNSVLVKPSELAPLSLLEFSELASAAGLPDGVFTVLPGLGHTTGTQLASHPLVRKVDITAGTQTGRSIGAMVGSNLAAFTAELGGKAPVIVFNDADLISAVNGVAFASFIASGQTCVSGARILVQDKVYDSFMNAFLDKVRNIAQRIGNPLNPMSSMGTVISEHHLGRIHRMVSSCNSGRVLVGGHRMSGTSPLDDFDLSRGCFYHPTVIEDVDIKGEVWEEEIFGPVIVVKKFVGEAEGVTLANMSKYGLGAGIWTTNLSRAHRVADSIQAGLVWINTHHRNDPSSPWGGMKDSGIGRENGIEALEAYSQSKSVIVNTATAEESQMQDDWFGDIENDRRYG